MRIQVRRRNGSWVEGYLIDVLPRGVAPDAALVRRYYGIAALADQYLPAAHARFVVRVAPEAYYILPDTVSGHRHWRFTNEIETR